MCHCPKSDKGPPISITGLSLWLTVVSDHNLTCDHNFHVSFFHSPPFFKSLYFIIIVSRAVINFGGCYLRSVLFSY